MSGGSRSAARLALVVATSVDRPIPAVMSILLKLAITSPPRGHLG